MRILRDWADSEGEFESPSRYYWYSKHKGPIRSVFLKEKETKEFHVKIKDINSGEYYTREELEDDAELMEEFKQIPSPGIGWWDFVRFTGEYFIYTKYSSDNKGDRNESK